jgi:hypothetical protein
MQTAYAHPQSYPHIHPHEHRAPMLDLLLALVFAVLVSAVGHQMWKKWKKTMSSRQSNKE